MERPKGLIQVYTGEGKGKTTASIGQAVRAAGHGFKVGFVYLFKNPQDFEYGEWEGLSKLGVRIFGFAPWHPHFYRNVPVETIREECLKGMDFVKKIMDEGTFDMLILDEINIALRDGFLKEEEVMALLDHRPEHLELVLTGRGATKGIIEKADLVSEIVKVKHPYDRGIKGRKGIEY